MADDELAQIRANRMAQMGAQVSSFRGNHFCCPDKSLETFVMIQQSKNIKVKSDLCLKLTL